MKVILALILIGIIFAPGTVSGGKYLASHYEVDCDIICNNSGTDSSIPMSLVLVGITAFAGIGLYYKFSKVGLYETFSLKCKLCRKSTNGLKCPECEAGKEEAESSSLSGRWIWGLQDKEI